MQRGQTKPAQEDDEVEKPIDYEHGQTGRTEFKVILIIENASDSSTNALRTKYL